MLTKLRSFPDANHVSPAEVSLYESDVAWPMRCFMLSDIALEPVPLSSLSTLGLSSRVNVKGDLSTAK